MLRFESFVSVFLGQRQSGVLRAVRRFLEVTSEETVWHQAPARPQRVFYCTN